MITGSGEWSAALLAYEDPNKQHDGQRRSETEPIVTTAMVVAESAYLIDRELGPHVEALLYQSIIDGALLVEPIIAVDW